MPNTPVPGSSFETPLFVNGVMKAKDKNKQTVWISSNTAGLGGGHNPIHVVTELPDPQSCETGTYLVINK